MKLVIGSILGSLIVVAIVIWFSILLHTTTEILVIAEKEALHPCQEITTELVSLFVNGTKLSTSEEREAFAMEYEERDNELQQQLIKNNCENTRSEWITDEFKGKIKFLSEYQLFP